jgi:hypothetical protein
MSFRSAINQQVLPNVFYENTTVDLNENILNSISSVQYVNDETLNINNDITDINNTLTSLQNQINDINNEITTLSNEIVRTTGSIFISFSTTAPAYSLLCDGSSYLVADYQNLFNVIGYSYGGSGISFSVPNMESKFLLGANGSLNGVPASNLLSGNGTPGALNNFYISGNSWANNPSSSPFPIMQFAPPHTHTVNDPGHSHQIGDYPNYGSFAPSTTPFVNSTQSADSFITSVNYTGISIRNNGPNIQQIDPYSNISGVNITPPFMSVNFFINI